MFKLIPTVRGGAVNSPLIFTRYETVAEARDATKALIQENARVQRVMIVDQANGSKFVEWIERS
jgi:translation elongation factor EF-Ts